VNDFWKLEGKTVDELANMLVASTNEAMASTPPDVDLNMAVFLCELARALDDAIRRTGQIPKRWTVAPCLGPYREAPPPGPPELPESHGAKIAREYNAIFSELARLRMDAEKMQISAEQRAKRNEDRTEFAHTALNGLLAGDRGHTENRAAHFARMAYDYAEAMMQERERREEGA
jgi:hypothetical protein